MTLSTVFHTPRNTTRFVFLRDKSPQVEFLFCSLFQHLSTNVNMMRRTGKQKNIENNSLMTRLVNLLDTQINALEKQMIITFQVPLPFNFFYSLFIFPTTPGFSGIRQNRLLLEKGVTQMQ